MVVGSVTFYQRDVKTQSKQYLVDINRIEASVKDASKWQEVNVQAYPNIDEIAYMNLQEDHVETIRNFYQEETSDQVVFHPYFENGEQVGVVRYKINVDNSNLFRLFILIQGCLFLMEVILVGMLLYVKHQIVLPFRQLSTLPTQLAKGHYKGDIKVTKTGYLREFLWGMSQLKDTLDISKKRQLELEKEKKQMLLSLSHDIKTPLNLIKLYGKAIEENLYEDTEATQQATRNIAERCDQIETYVNEIMMHSREDILDIQVEMGEFYLSQFIAQIQATYQEPCKQRMLDFNIHSFQDRMIKGDQNRLQEVVENLFENAFKYGDGRKIEIFFEEEEYCQLIHFYNSGNMVEEEEWNHLFDSFYRAKNAKGVQGSGLGLYICKTIMRKMDGDIYLERRTDGMEFVLVLR